MVNMKILISGLKFQRILFSVAVSGLLFHGGLRAADMSSSEAFFSQRKAIEDVSFRYTVSNGFLASKSVEYVASGPKFVYRWRDETTGGIVKMLAYDGIFYYCLHGDSHLVVTRDAEREAEFIATWTKYNPVLNPLSRLFGNVSPFTPDNVFADRTLLALESLQPEEGADITNRDVKGKEVTMEYTFSDGYPFPIRIVNTTKGLGTQEWRIEEFVDREVQEATLPKVPRVIKCIETDIAGRVSPMSFEIRIDPESITMIGDDVSVDEFRIPFTAVKSVYDADAKVYLRASDISISPAQGKSR